MSAAPSTSTPSRTSSSAMDIALIASFAALIAVCALLPALATVSGVPFTLQMFGVLLAGAVLGARRGFLAVLLYLVAGAAGLPIFAGGASGLGTFLGVSGGYLISFPVAAGLCGLIVERLRWRADAKGFAGVLAAALIATFVIVHPLGVLGMMWRAPAPFTTALGWDTPFIAVDALKCLVVAIVALPVHRAFGDLLPQRR